MAQGAAKSALIYGTLGTALFITCEVCGTGPSTAPVARATPVQEASCQSDAGAEAAFPFETNTDSAAHRAADPACLKQEQPSGGS